MQHLGDLGRAAERGTAAVTGELNGLTGAIAATVSYVGGTGRFAAASGSASLAGQLGAGGTISVTVSGTIDF